MSYQTYTAIVTQSEDGKFCLLFHNLDLTLGSATGTTVEEAITLAETSLSQQLDNYVKHTGSMPDRSFMFTIPGDPGLLRVLLKVEVNAQVETITADVSSELAHKIKDFARKHGTDVSGLINEATRQMVGESSKGYSFFYRALLRITSYVKNQIHADIEAKYSEKWWQKWVNKIKTPFMFTDPNYKISLEVYNRLLLRYALLRDIEKLESRYGAHSSFKREKTLDQPLSQITESNVELQAEDQKAHGVSQHSTKKDSVNPAVRAYKLATTDVFVEKAIAFLEVDSDKYRFRGTLSFIVASIVIVIGIVISFVQVHPELFEQYKDVQKHAPANWLEFTVSFSKSFTFYGLLILLVVGLWRLGRAMLDQAERLKERRHALRQGRLYVHLNDGELNPDELDKAFAWNKSGGNAFGDIPTEASAPWGAVFKEAFKAFGETFKKSAEKAAEKVGENVVK